jgi:2-(1,2-epoxy-1,2-dihydrophenyl)acetyl-CoA isomerase
VLPVEGFAEAIAERAATWAALPTLAVALTKELFESADTATLEEQLAMEARLQDAARASADHAEGVAAFLEKRRATFTGT